MNPDPRSAWLRDAIDRGASTVTVGDRLYLDAFRDGRDEYAAATRGAALLDRSDRGLLRITGRDRADWLHNLVTNQVRTLAPADGQYAFALNIKGRILFDLYILVLRDEIWIDLDRRWIPAALKHLEKYIITEDVRLADASEAFSRLMLMGPRATGLLTAMDLTRAASLPLLQSATWTCRGYDVFTVRSDGFGVRAFDLMFPPQAWPAVVRSLTDGGGATWIGRHTAETLRIEAGIPAPFSELNDDVLPAETGQLTRAVSFNKGCYLGQEIVERMRSRHALARRLMGVIAREGGSLSAGDRLLADGGQSGEQSGGQSGGQIVAVITSACESPSLGRSVGMAFLKTALAQPGVHLGVESTRPGAATEVITAELPLVRHEMD